MYHQHNYCRACGYARPGANGIKASPTDKLIEVLDLGVQPLANDFRKPGEEHSGFAPLKVMVCPVCLLAQLSVVVKPEILYRNYSYVTSPSAMMREHFGHLVADIKDETDGRSVLEIGSNDGRLLSLMRDDGFSVFGVDPAENLVDIAVTGGIETQCGFFGEKMSRAMPKFDVVVARHVFCHCNDWRDFVLGLENVAHRETLICIEVPYAGDTIKNCEFDQVYHEHLSFLNIKAMDFLLRDTTLQIHRILKYPIHGGAVLIMLRRKDSEKVPDRSFFEYISLDDWKEFGIAAQAQIFALKDMVITLRSQQKRVAALGASAKSTVWINACEFTRKQVEFISDNTPQKQLTFSPGTDIPVVDEGAIMRELPDYVIMFAWNYKTELLEKFHRARENGVKFIIPLKTIEVV